MNNETTINNVDAKTYMNAVNEYGKVHTPHFEIVSFEQFVADWVAAFDEYDMEDDSIAEIRDIYNSIKFPSRSTSGSAGYDFFSPIDFYLNPGQTIMIPTGIRVYMPKDMVLMIYPRSGLGTKYHMALANTVGIVDSDYYYADNEGHIHLKMVNNGNERIYIDAGQGFSQGVFTHYLTTYGDSAHNTRHGGLGSTDNR